MNYKTSVSGTLPDTRPLFLAPVHRAATDTYAIGDATKEFVAFVSTDTYGHNRVANWAQKIATKALGSVVWQESGLPNKRARAIALTRDVDYRINKGMIVGFFAQGEYQPNSVDSIEPGLFGMLQRYKNRKTNPIGIDSEVTVIPVGISYDRNGAGFVQSRFSDFLSKYVLLFPQWSVPARNTRVVVTFGTAQQFGSEDADEFTARIMQEAARLSKIPYLIVHDPLAAAGTSDSNVDDGTVDR